MRPGGLVAALDASSVDRRVEQRVEHLRHPLGHLRPRGGALLAAGRLRRRFGKLNTLNVHAEEYLQGIAPPLRHSKTCFRLARRRASWKPLRRPPTRVNCGCPHERSDPFSLSPSCERAGQHRRGLLISCAPTLDPLVLLSGRVARRALAQSREGRVRGRAHGRLRSRGVCWSWRSPLRRRSCPRVTGVLPFEKLCQAPSCARKRKPSVLPAEGLSSRQRRPCTRSGDIKALQISSLVNMTTTP